MPDPSSYEAQLVGAMIDGVGGPVTLTKPTTPTQSNIFNSQPTGIVGASPMNDGSLTGKAFQALHDYNPINMATDAIFGKSPASSGYTGSGGALSWISDIFLRSVVIILGFIFVAVGLSMFKSSQSIIKTVAKVAP